MSLLDMLRNHKHYWSRPLHKVFEDPSSPLIQVCYSCGKERFLTVELRVPAQQIAQRST